MNDLSGQEKAIINAQLVPDSARTELQRFWKANAKQIAAVTAGGDVERVLRVTYSLLYRTPKLVECTPFSLLNGIVLAHQLGLVFGTPEVSLVPFGREATLIIGYQGKVKLALASKLITAIHADVILVGDVFECEMRETGLHFRHKVEWVNRQKATADNLIAAYCQLRTTEGGVQTRIVSLPEILDARDRSRGYRYQIQKGKEDNPWITDFGAMALKTAVHRAMKLAPQDARMGLATAVDDEEQGAGAIIADGLDPSAFGPRELNDPLVPTGIEAAQKVAETKIAEGTRRKREPADQPPTVDALPDCVPMMAGSSVRHLGKVWVVVDTAEGHEWQAMQ